LFGAVSMLVSNLAGWQDHTQAEKVLALLAETDPALITAVFAVITLLLYIVSMKVSVVFYKKRELF
jgi:hypothetical protein